MATKSTQRRTGAVNIGELTGRIYSLIAPLKDEEKSKVISAVAALADYQPAAQKPPEVQRGAAESDEKERTSPEGAVTPRRFFDDKEPKYKIEMLAVAARFREKVEDAEAHTKEDLCKVYKAARRDFDSHKFDRDIGNAKNAGLFNRDSGKGTYTLSHKGQKFVDQLPNREGLRRPKGRRRAAKRKKKTTKKAVKRRA